MALRLNDYSRSSTTGRLTDELKFRIVECYIQHANVAKVAKLLKVNNETVRRWVICYSTTGKVDALKPGGRRKAIDATVAAEIVDVMLDSRYTNATSSGVQN